MLFTIVAGSTITWTAVGWSEPVSGIDLRWSAPVRCPSAANVRERIQHLLGAVAESRLEHIVADVDVVQAGRRYQLTLNLRSNGSPLGKGRSFESESCDSLAGAAAVTVAMLVRSDSPSNAGSRSTSPGAAPRPSAEPNAAASGDTLATPAANAPSPHAAQGTQGAAPGATSGTSSPPQSAPPRAPPANATLARTAPDAITATTPSGQQTTPSGQQEDSWHPLIHGPVLGFDGGVLPSWSYGFAAGLGVRKGLFDVVLDGRYSPPQSASLGDYTSSFERRGASATGCYEWRSGPIGLGPCVSLAFDDVTARGNGRYVTPSSDDVVWLSAGLAMRARWLFGTHAALFVTPGLFISISRPTFTVDGFGQIYQMPLAAFATSFGCEWIL